MVIFVKKTGPHLLALSLAMFKAGFIKIFLFGYNPLAFPTFHYGKSKHSPVFSLLHLLIRLYVKCTPFKNPYFLSASTL